MELSLVLLYFFFNDTATTEIYTLSLHDALPIFARVDDLTPGSAPPEEQVWHTYPPVEMPSAEGVIAALTRPETWRSEEHTSELQSRQYLVCRLLLEKKKIITTTFTLIYIELYST